MNPEFLTHADVVELTSLTQGAAQIRWLRKERIKVFVRADGKPRVLWSDLKDRKDGRHRGPVQPNFEALHAPR